MKEQRDGMRRAEEAWLIRARNAAQSLEIAEDILAEHPPAPLEARALTTLAYAEMRRASYEKGVAHAERALMIHREVGDRLWEGWTLFVLGVLGRWQNRKDEGADYYHQAIAIAEEVGRPDLAAYACNGLGNLARSAGEFDTARERFTACVEKGVASGDREAEVYGHFGVGAAWFEQGNLDEAERAFLRCREISLEIDFTHFLATVDSSLSQILELRGDLVAALELQRETTEYLRSRGEWREVTTGLLGLGEKYRIFGEYRAGLEKVRDALELTERYGLDDLKGSVLLHIATLYESIEESDNGLPYYLRAYYSALESGSVRDQVTAMIYLGRWYRGHHEEPKALAYYFKALELSNEKQIAFGSRSATQAIGNCYVGLGMDHHAEEYFARSMEIAEQLDSRFETASVHHAVGVHLMRRERYAESRERLQEALTLYRDIDARDRQLYLLKNLQELAEMEGNQEELRHVVAERLDLSNTIFTSESSRRLTTLIGNVEGEQARYQGEELGLEQSDLEKITEAAGVWEMRRAKESHRRDLSEKQNDRRSAERTEPTAEQTAEGSGERERRRRMIVRTLGTFAVEIEGVLVEKTAWKRKRARDLFKLLLLNHRRVVSVGRIEEYFWGEPKEKIESLVANAASHVRSALGLGSERKEGEPSLARVGEGYLLDLGDDVSIDFMEFQERIITARRSEKAAERRAEYEEALRLYTGEFLPEEMAEWTEHQRMLMKDAWFEGAEFVAREQLRLGEHHRAVATARDILEQDRTSESGWTILLSALTGAGRNAEAQSEYQRCILCFAEEFDEEPPEELRNIV